MNNLGIYYDATSDWQSAKWQQLVALAESNLSLIPGKNLLDLGCGSGKRTRQLFYQFEQNMAVGIDYHPDMVKTAAEKYGSDRITFQKFDLNKGLPKLKTSFQLVQSNYALHWIEQKERLFKDLNKFTESGALLLIGTCTALPNIFLDIDAVLEQHGVSYSHNPYHYLNLNEWQSFLNSYGWELNSSKYIENDEHLTEDADAFVAHWMSASTERILGQGESFTKLPAEVFSDAVRTIKEKYRYKDTDRLLFTEETLLMVVRKK